MTDGIGSVEIHIYRADPSKHDGKEGFLYAIERGDFYTKRVYSKDVYDSRQQAASAAGLWLDRLEDCLRAAETGGHG